MHSITKGHRIQKGKEHEDTAKNLQTLLKNQMKICFDAKEFWNLCMVLKADFSMYFLKSARVHFCTKNKLSSQMFLFSFLKEIKQKKANNLMSILFI